METTNTLRPLNGQVLVKKDDPKDKTKGGIVLPDTGRDQSTTGTVVAVSAGKLTDKGVFVEPSVKKGDRVVYSKYAGTDVKVGGVQHFLIEESNILCVLEDGAEVD